MAASSACCISERQHDKFIATLAAYGIGAANATPQPLGDRLQKFVADGMSKRIIDMLESVQIQKEHTHFFVVTWRGGDGLFQAVIQEHAIGQAGQKVVLG
jgi:hypothetical protein